MGKFRLDEVTDKARNASIFDKDYVMELVRVLHDEFGGYVPPEIIEEVSERLDIPASRLYEIITFYTLYSMKKEAKHVIRVCASLPCHVAGGRKVMETLLEELGIDFGETTKDGIFKLEKVGCLGRCDTSPNMMIDSTLYRNLTPEKVKAILAVYRREG